MNRVVLLSDGDANVGPTEPAALVGLIRARADRGITLTTAGFGAGNYQDTTMERLADDGDGNYVYIDSEAEARRVFVDQLTSTLVTIARDVKVQVEWDSAAVRSYRLMGYENRDLPDDDFRDDRVDAGEIGAGHQVTALYEIVLAPELAAAAELAVVRIRSEPAEPDATASERSYRLARGVLRDDFDRADRDLRRAVAVAAFAERLRGSSHLPSATFERIAAIARAARSTAADDELIGLVEKAERLRQQPAPDRNCHEVQLVSGNQRKVVRVNENGVLCE